MAFKNENKYPPPYKYFIIDDVWPYVKTITIKVKEDWTGYNKLEEPYGKDLTFVILHLSV